MLLVDMVRDPLTNLPVDPGWAEPPLMRPPVDITDGVALENPAPDLDQIGTVIQVGQLFDMHTGDPFRPLWMLYEAAGPLIRSVGVGAYLTDEFGNTLITEAGVPIMIENDEFLLTEDGQILDTEDGQGIKLEVGNTVLTEDGQIIFTEDNQPLTL